MRAATVSQWSSMSSGVTCALFGWLNTRRAAAFWIICSGFTTQQTHTLTRSYAYTHTHTHTHTHTLTFVRTHCYTHIQVPTRTYKHSHQKTLGYNIPYGSPPFCPIFL